jgi:hypothetical protein
MDPNGGKNYTRTGKKLNMEMYDVKLKKKLNVEVELVVLKNKRYAVTGVNPESGMTMFKLVSKAKAQEIMGEITV